MGLKLDLFVDEAFRKTIQKTIREEIGIMVRGEVQKLAAAELADRVARLAIKAPDQYTIASALRQEIQATLTRDSVYYQTEAKKVIDAYVEERINKRWTDTAIDNVKKIAADVFRAMFRDLVK